MNNDIFSLYEQANHQALLELEQELLEKKDYARLAIFKKLSKGGAKNDAN